LLIIFYDFVNFFFMEGRIILNIFKNNLFNINMNSEDQIKKLKEEIEKLKYENDILKKSLQAVKDIFKIKC